MRTGEPDDNKKKDRKKHNDKKDVQTHSSHNEKRRKT